MTAVPPTILWFRQDLRLADHPALSAAVAAGPVLPLYILDDETPGEDRIGGAGRWWLHHSLETLGRELERRGAPLVLRRGRSEAVLRALMAETGASRVHATRAYEPWWRAADAALGDALTLHDGNFLADPATVTTRTGGRYAIFTPFWRALLDRMPPAPPLPAPDRIDGVAAASDALADWGLRPTAPDWSTGFSAWTPGEAGAAQSLDGFLARVEAYEHGRNLPSSEGTSRLSPHLHWGEISPATVWHAVSEVAGAGAAEPYLRELGWRDFAANVIERRPDYGHAHGRSGHGELRTRDGEAAERDFRAWTRGRTGYPIVDAGMRELWATGWMHNRVRMIAASFLVKHLLVDWRRGWTWFWDTLVDADYGSNSVNWQWIAGSGVDASQFTRVMAPLTQSAKFDAAAYIRRWVPELADVPDAAIHDPHGEGAAPAAYPRPLIGHREARERALAAWAAVKGGAAPRTPPG